MESKANVRIDDQFWFDHSKDMIKQTKTGQNDAAAKLQNMIAWLWGIYSAALAVGLTTFWHDISRLIVCLMLAPSIVLISAYWTSVWAQMPIKTTFNPEIASQIREAYLRGTRMKRRILTFALILSALGAFMLSFVIILLSATRSQDRNHMEAFFFYNADSSQVVFVYATCPAKKHVEINISNPHCDNGQSFSKRLMVYSGERGNIEENIEVSKFCGDVELTAEWVENGVTHKMVCTAKTSKSRRE